MMKSFKLALLLGVALGASAANTMARESSEGPRGGDPDAIVLPSNPIARERSEGPRGRDPRAIVDQQWDKVARRGEAPRGGDDEGNDIGDDNGGHAYGKSDQLARGGDDEGNDIGDDHGTGA